MQFPVLQTKIFSCKCCKAIFSTTFFRWTEFQISSWDPCLQAHCHDNCDRNVLEKMGSNQLLQVSLNSTQPSNMSSDELAIKYMNLVQMNILSPDELALVNHSLDNVSLVENSILEGNSILAENSSLVERILLVGNSTNWRDQLDFPLLQVSVCGVKGWIFPIILLSIISHIWTALGNPLNTTKYTKYGFFSVRGRAHIT